MLIFMKFRGIYNFVFLHLLKGPFFLNIAIFHAFKWRGSE